MSGQQVKFRVGDVIKPVCWRVPKAKFAVVIRVYTGGGDGVRVVPDTSVWYERIIGALLTNDMEPLIANREAIEKDSVQVYSSELRTIK